MRIIFGVVGLVFLLQTGAMAAAPDARTAMLNDYRAQRELARDQVMASSSSSAYDYSSQTSGGAGGGRKTHQFRGGVEVYDYEYEETVRGSQFIKDQGTFVGVFADYTYRPEGVDPSLSDYIDVYRVEARAAMADVDYDGGVQDSNGNKVADLTLSNIPDVVMEGRLLAGKDLMWRGYQFTPYSGFGARYLKDDTSDVYGTFVYAGNTYSINGYTRKSEYYYLPLGVDVSKSFGSVWSVGTNAEFDYLLYGKQRSYIETTSGGVPENRQGDGYGLRASLRVEMMTRLCGVSVEPFVRYWDIEDSEVANGIMEPSNTTREIGLKVGLLF